MTLQRSETITPTAIDPITVEVIRSKLNSYIGEMTEVMRRAAYSPIIYEVYDFSNTVHDRDGNAVAMALGIPMFLGAMSPVVKAVLSQIPPEEWEPGDIVICNDPHHDGNTHVNDINIVTPIFHEGEAVLFAMSKAHWLDVGGKNPGSWSPDCTDMFQEGLRIPVVRLYRRGEVVDDVRRLLLANVRAPEYSAGDLDAQVSACRHVVRRVETLVDDYGWGTIDAALEEILDHGERMVRTAIEEIPDGEYLVVDEVDSDGRTDEPVVIRLKLTVKGSEVTADFSESDLQRREACGNASFAVTQSGVRLAMRCFADPDLPSNEGCYRPITVIAPAGTCVNAVPPAPVTTGGLDIGHVVIESVFQAMAQAVPDRAIAGLYGSVSALVLAGYDGDQSYVHISPYSGGWGARATKDGINGLMTILNGDCNNVPCEVVERKFPLRVERYALLDDTGGPGRFRGGLGIATDYRLMTDGVMSTALMRYRHGPWGLFGGGAGKASVTVVNPGTDEERRHHSGGGIPLKAGDLVSHRVGGGGGFGPAAERDLELIERDLREGYVSAKAAVHEYGVTVEPDGTVRR
ncbi:MAG: N-methylhydantoinase [Baekduia sp.]|nr:N-methylhydantoinase [Baekduia sp.]